MKKISILMALLAVMVGFSSCSEDKDPVVQTPTKFELNTPALASQYFELTPTGSLVFTCSQPDYGFTASTTYGLQVSLTEGGESYILTPEEPTSAVIRVKAVDVATAMCVLRGITNEDQWTEIEPIPLYFSATAQLGDHGSSFIQSNWVRLDQVKGYFAVPVPNYIYLVGSPEGWNGPDAANADHYADWRLFEKTDAIGSNIYYGVFNMPASPIFRFYAKLSGWDGGDSWGSQEDDSPLDYELAADGSVTEDLVHGKGSFSFPSWTGGEMTIIVDMNSNKVTFLGGNQM